MKLGWFSNAPFLPSGYGGQTRLIVPRLKQLGHEAVVLASHGVEMGVIHWEGIPILPKSAAFWSQDRIGPYSRKYGLDATICFADAWVMAPWNYGPGVRFVPYFPVDTEELSRAAIPVLRQSWDRIVYSEAGLRALQAEGMDAHLIPHGVDLNEFFPENKSEARAKLGIPDDGRLIVGVVAANNDPIPTRKNWEGILEGFSLFHKTNPDSLLYLHTWLNGGAELHTLIEMWGLGGKVRVCEGLQLTIGHSNAHMRATYNAFDVMLLPSRGEGCGLPLLEAAACGIPTITGDWTAMPEYQQSGILIRKEEAVKELISLHYGHQYAAPAAVIAEKLREFANSESKWREWRNQAVKGAQRFDIDVLVETGWKPVLAAMEARIADEKRAGKAAKRQPLTNKDWEIGTQTLTAVAQERKPRVVMVCPSIGEECGIAEYSQTAMRSLMAAGVETMLVDTVAGACSIAEVVDSVEVVFVQHEYAFFDDLNPKLGRGEQTDAILRHLAKLRAIRPGIRTALYIHTVSTRGEYRDINQKISRAQESGLEVYATSARGANYLHCLSLPLGTFRDDTIPVPERAPSTFSIGNAGILGEHRDVESFVLLCKETGSAVVGSFACFSPAMEKQLRELMVDAGVTVKELWTDYAETEADLIARLAHADVLYMPRRDNENHYSSASVLTAMNAGRPIIINRAACYADLYDVLTIADTVQEAKQAIERLRDPVEYEKAVAKIREYQRERDIARVWAEGGLIK